MDSKKKARWPPSRYWTLCFDVATRTSIPASSMSRSSSAVSNGAVSCRLVTSSMIDLLDFQDSSGHGATLSNSALRMNPFGLRRAQIRNPWPRPLVGTQVRRRQRHVKTPPSPRSGRDYSTSMPKLNSRLRRRFCICKIYAYRQRVYARAMQYEFLFIFPKGIRTAIEYRV